MNEIIQVLLKVLPIVLLLLLGFWMKKTHFFSAEVINGLQKLVLSIALPCLLFLTFFQAKLEMDLMFLSLMVFAICLLMFAAGFLIKKMQKSTNPFYPSLFTTFLTGPIGYPLFMAYFGSENLYKLAILDVGNTVFIFTVLTVFLSTVSCDIQAARRKGIAAHLKNLVQSPLTMSIFIGITFSLTGINSTIGKVPAVASLVDTLTLMASATFPLTLLIIGYKLPFDFKSTRKTLAAVLIRLTLMLAIAYLINTFIIIRWLGLDAIYQAAIYTLFLLPPPFIIPLSIIGECDHKEFVLNFISLHLPVSIIAFVAMLAVI